MNREAISHVFFDLDHTLWDFDKNSMLAFRRVFKKHNINIEIEDFLNVYEPINLNYWKLFREEKVNKEQLRRGRLTDAFEAFKIKYTIPTIDLLAESYIDELPGDNHLFEGALDILEYLSKRYTLHIITNGFQEVQYIKLKKSGIHDFFKTITTSEEVGLKKPNPVIFIRALEKAKTTEHNSIMIGDSFEADIMGAEAVGMKTLFYNYRNDEVPDNYNVVKKLSEIKNHL